MKFAEDIIISPYITEKVIWKLQRKVHLHCR